MPHDWAAAAAFGDRGASWLSKGPCRHVVDTWASKEFRYPNSLQPMLKEILEPLGSLLSGFQ